MAVNKVTEVRYSLISLKREIIQLLELDTWTSMHSLPLTVSDTVRIDLVSSIRAAELKIRDAGAQYRLAYLRWLVAETKYKLEHNNA